MTSIASLPQLAEKLVEQDRPDKRPFPGSAPSENCQEQQSDDEDENEEDDQDRQSVMSHENTSRSDSTSQPPAKTRKKPGRKPNPASPAVRKEQNRAAQRAFRDRKERHLQQLENMIKELKDTHHHANVRFQRETQQLKGIIESLQSENYYLREVVFSFESALGKTGNAAILQDVKAELYRRHYENHAARKMSLSVPHQQSSPMTPSLPCESPMSVNAPSPHHAPSPAPIPTSAHAPGIPPNPVVIPGPVPVDDSIPHATQVQMLQQALAAAMAVRGPAFSNPNVAPNINSDNNNNGNVNNCQPPLATNSMPANMMSSSSSASSSSTAWTQFGLADPQDDNIFSMNNEALYKAPTLLSNGDDGKMNAPAPAEPSLSASRPNYTATQGNWLPKQSVFEDLFFTQGNIHQPANNKMPTSPQTMAADASLFGQMQDQSSFSPNQNMFTFTSGSMDSAFPAQTTPFLDTDDVDSNEFSMATPNLSFDDSLKQDIIPSYRLQAEIRILASAPPATDPKIDPKIYALPHDSRIDLIPCPKLRAQMILHQNEYDIEDLCQLLIGGAICHGPPLDPHNWELPRAFFDRYGYLMGQELMKYKNKVWPKKNGSQRQNVFRTF